jgi:hypothetical protein
MKTQLLCLSFLVSLCGTALAQASDSTIYPKKFAWAISWDHPQHGQSFTIELQSPQFASYKDKADQLTLLRGYVTVSSLQIENTVVDKDGKFQDEGAIVSSTGVSILTPLASGIVSSYAQVGGLMVNPSNELSSKNNLLGAKVTIGIEFPFTRGTALNTAFVQSTITEFVDTADKIAGEPDLFNGVTMSLGARVYY